MTEFQEPRDDACPQVGKALKGGNEQEDQPKAGYKDMRSC
jgi:hypothetical protein